MVNFQSHYVPKKISEIDPDVDVKVRVTGTVIDVSDVVILDDGTASIRVLVTEGAKEKIKPNSLIRVFGIVIGGEDRPEIKADIVQDLSSLDVKLFKKVQELYNKWGCELSV